MIKKHETLSKKSLNNLRLNGHVVELTHTDKYYFPKSKITKGDLIDYYVKIAPRLLPYCKDRPITMQRFVEGITGESFYQKNAGDYFPDWIERAAIAQISQGHEGLTTHYVVCNNAATLVYLANQGCITPHMWLSKVGSLHNPDSIVFDLDPAGGVVRNFKPIADAAYMLKDILENCGLTPFVMTTGSRGLHVRVVLKPEYDFDEVRAFAREVAGLIVKHYPEEYTLEARKEQRGSKLLIDVMRNSFGATAVIPYAVRPHEGAPVATPLAWRELEDSKLRSDTYTIKTVFERAGDVWKDFGKVKGSLAKAQALLKKLYV